MSLALVMPRIMKASKSGLVILVLCGLILTSLPLLEAIDEGDSCTVKNLPGVCRASSVCEPLLEKYIRSGTLTPNDIPTCSLGTREEIVCCPIEESGPDEPGPDTTTTRTIQPTPTTRVDANPSKERPAVRACRMIEKRDTENALSPHILDGVPVDDGVYPHMAAIAFSNFGTFDYRCGGSLISRRHVLTAAHCVNSEELTPVHVRLGTVNIDQVNAYYQDIKVISNITIHPEYVSSSKYNDIAILELAEDARLNHWIYPACLDTNIVDPPKESKIFVAGWGVMNQTTRRTSKILLRAPLTIVPLDDCNKLFAEFPSSTRFIKDGIINTLLCAADVGQNKKDACQGDSGGPLVLEHDIVNNMYSILGVISSGFGCATKTPGLYTRVASYLDFIESVVWPNNVVENLSNST